MLKARRSEYLQAVRAVKEVVILVEEGKRLLEDLRMRAVEQPLEHEEEVAVVQFCLERCVVEQTHLGEGEVCELLLRHDVVQGGAEPALVAD